MRKFLTESKATVDDSEKLMFSKRSRGKVRLPPLATTVVIENYGWREGTRRHKEDEDGAEDSAIFSGNTYPSATDNLITPKVFKLPMSPSNLSIQFNFDDVQSEPKQLVKCLVKDGKSRSRSRKGHKRLRSTTVVPNEASIGKGHNIHRSGDKTPATSDVKTAKVMGRYRTLSNASVVKSMSSARGRKTNAKTMSATFSAERLSSTVTRLDVNEDEQRKSSIYNLREFLSLPSDGNEEKIPPVLKKDSMKKTPAAGKGKHAKVKHVKNSPKLYRALYNKPSEEYMYDLFEFLTLAEQEKPASSRRKGKKKLKGISKVEQVPKVHQGNTKPSVVENSGIPSVVVADWSLKEDSTPRELPKVDLPTSDFPGRSEVLLAPSDDPRRTSLYNLQEILNLNTLSRNSTVKNVATHKPESSRESEAQCDLQEFLAFLESRASNHRGSESNGGPESGVSSERSATTALVDTYRSRTISVHDIYEFLKSTSSTNLQNGEIQMHVRTADSASLDDFQQNLSNRKTSVITLKDFFAESSRSECPVNDKHKLAACEANRSRSSSSNSMYNLRDFLGLPAVATNYEGSRAECYERSQAE